MGVRLDVDTLAALFRSVSSPSLRILSVLISAFLFSFDPASLNCRDPSIFRHFDPNESGSVHYGEFVWAFFNRR